jgi:hypothetical protein
MRERITIGTATPVAIFAPLERPIFEEETLGAWEEVGDVDVEVVIVGESWLSVFEIAVADDVEALGSIDETVAAAVVVILALMASKDAFISLCRLDEIDAGNLLRSEGAHATLRNGISIRALIGTV